MSRRPPHGIRYMSQLFRDPPPACWLGQRRGTPRPTSKARPLHDRCVEVTDDRRPGPHPWHQVRVEKHASVTGPSQPGLRWQTGFSPQWNLLQNPSAGVAAGPSSVWATRGPKRSHRGSPPFAGLLCGCAPGL